MKKVILLAISLCILSTSFISGQNNNFLCRAVIKNNDTIPYVELKSFMVFGFGINVSKREVRRRTKLIRNVIKVYPYARLTSERLEQYDEMLAKIPDREKRDKSMRKIEKAFIREFTPTIKEMTFSQGIILLKLVDRENGKTTYRIVNELRGKLRAFFYQSIARLWHYNLKDKYDPEGRDREIEKIVKQIETGEIKI